MDQVAKLLLFFLSDEKTDDDLLHILGTKDKLDLFLLIVGFVSLRYTASVLKELMPNPYSEISI